MRRTLPVPNVELIPIAPESVTTRRRHEEADTFGFRVAHLHMPS
jgi:hypothetical protein